jgi:hypothetical protein
MEKCCQEERHNQNFNYYSDVAGYLHSNCTLTAQEYEAEEGDP